MTDPLRALRSELQSHTIAVRQATVTLGLAVPAMWGLKELLAHYPAWGEERIKKELRDRLNLKRHRGQGVEVHVSQVRELDAQLSAENNPMQRSKIASLVALLCLIGAAHGMEILGVDFREDDKQNHAVLGVASAAVAMLALDRIKPDAPWYARAATGIAAAAVVGAVKELADSRDPLRHTADIDDFTATTLGGALVSLTFCWRF